MRLFATGWAVLALIALPLTGSLAQTAKKPAKAAADDKNRITRTDLGFSYIPPAGYNETHLFPDAKLAFVGSDVAQRTRLPDAEGGTRLNIYETMILVHRHDELPTLRHLTFGSDFAKRFVDILNKQRAATKTENPLNYQNSAEVTVAGHQAQAILCEATLTGAEDPVLLRIILFLHRGKLYAFSFQAPETDFEAKVPAFESMMNSLKFLEPDVALPADDNSGPKEIKIGQ